MKLFFCLLFLSALLWQGKAATIATTKATTSHLTTNDSPKNLTGKMMTLSESSILIFHPKQDNVAPRESTGVSVCLRFGVGIDAKNVFLFQLMYNMSAYDTSVYSTSVIVILKSYQQYSVFFNKSEVPLLPFANTWFSVRSFTWTRVCLTLDTQNNVIQLFQDSEMSIRKILPFKTVLSGLPLLSLSGFDGQVTDLQVWDHPLQYSEVSDYMMENGVEGTLMTWSNIVFDSYGALLVEDSYPGRNEGEEQPIMSELEWAQLLKYKRMLPRKGQRKRQML